MGNYRVRPDNIQVPVSYEWFVLDAGMSGDIPVRAISEFKKKTPLL